MPTPAPLVRVAHIGTLVPGPASAETGCLRANNNLDLARHDGRWYLAWRTAPSHFASAEARLEVVSAPKLEGPWRSETAVVPGRDVREPRFNAHQGRLHLSYLVLGTDPKRFQPQGAWRTTWDGQAWQAPALAIDADVVPWRIRKLGGRWAMLGYRGAERMYGPRPADPVVELRWSDDLESWGPPVDLHVGGTECDLVELPDGRVLGVTRNEGPSRRGGDVLVAPDVDHLQVGGVAVTPISRKLDSPHLVRWGGASWLFARRQVPHRGRYDLAPAWLGDNLAMRVDQAVWSATRKRSALFRVEADRPRLLFEADLPSGGDTAFVAAVPDDDGSLVVADYRTPPGRGDIAWIRGQLGATEVVLHRLRIDPSST